MLATRTGREWYNSRTGSSPDTAQSRRAHRPAHTAPLPSISYQGLQHALRGRPRLPRAAARPYAAATRPVLAPRRAPSARGACESGAGNTHSLEEVRFILRRVPEWRILRHPFFEAVPFFLRLTSLLSIDRAGMKCPLANPPLPLRNSFLLPIPGAGHTWAVLAASRAARMAAAHWRSSSRARCRNRALSRKARPSSCSTHHNVATRPVA